MLLRPGIHFRVLYKAYPLYLKYLPITVKEGHIGKEKLQALDQCFYTQKHSYPSFDRFCTLAEYGHYSAMDRNMV